MEEKNNKLLKILCYVAFGIIIVGALVILSLCLYKYFGEGYSITQLKEYLSSIFSKAYCWVTAGISFITGGFSYIGVKVASIIYSANSYKKKLEDNNSQLVENNEKLSALQSAVVDALKTINTKYQEKQDIIIDINNSLINLTESLLDNVYDQSIKDKCIELIDTAKSNMNELNTISEQIKSSIENANEKAQNNA